MGRYGQSSPLFCVSLSSVTKKRQSLIQDMCVYVCVFGGERSRTASQWCHTSTDRRWLDSQ